MQMPNPHDLFAGFCLGVVLAITIAAIISTAYRQRHRELQSDLEQSDQIAEILENKHTKACEQILLLKNRTTEYINRIEAQNRLIADLESEITNLQNPQPQNGNS